MFIRPPRVRKTEAEWRTLLSPVEFRMLRGKKTEPPQSYLFYKNFDASLNPFTRATQGYFACRGCGLPLYSARSKFESESGWPAFDRCFRGTVETFLDDSFGLKRKEIHCAACEGHLGHVFVGEGFTETLERHCVNSVSLQYRGDVPSKEYIQAEGPILLTSSP